ncbi:MAG: alpha/beta hydrolase [Promethearchaeota archaeon]
MSRLEYKDYWFNYIIDEDPQKIKALIREDYITSQGLKIHMDIYDDESKSLDKTIIFLHGTSVYSRFYAEFCFNLFKRGYRIVAPDMLGHGLSEGVRGHFTMEKLAKVTYDVNSYVIKNFGEKNVVMGSSLGGCNALYSIAYDDERLKGAICHNAAVFNEKAYKKIIKMNLLLRFVRPLVPIVAKIAPKFKVSVWLYLDFKKLAKTDKILEKIDTFLKDPLLSDKYTATAIKTQMRAPLAKPIEKIISPVMIINGDEDYLFSVDYMTELYNRLTCKNKALEILKNASHLILQENIEEVIEHIVPWLKKIL